MFPLIETLLETCAKVGLARSKCRENYVYVLGSSQWRIKLDSMKGEQFLDQLSDYWLLNKDSVPRRQCFKTEHRNFRFHVVTQKLILLKTWCVAYILKQEVQWWKHKIIIIIIIE